MNIGMLNCLKEFSIKQLLMILLVAYMVTKYISHEFNSKVVGLIYGSMVGSIMFFLICIMYFIINQV